jgi:hypothetical protein
LGFEADEIRAKKEVQALIRAVREHYPNQLAADRYSCLETIRIGWKLPGFALAPILQQVIPLLMQRPANVKHLELNLSTWAPSSTLIRLVSWTNLDSLTLRSVRIRTRCLSDRRHDRQSFDWERIDTNIALLLLHIPQSLITLNLIDCDIQTSHIPRICEALKKLRNLESFSMRHNRDLDGGWKELFSLNTISSLNFSLCDLDSADGHYIAQGLKNNRTLKQLSLAGNYRMTVAIPELLQVSSTSGLVELDFSFCDIQNHLQCKIFTMLATIEGCTIRSLRMQGVRIKDYDALIKCIENNKSLQRLVLNHPRDRSKPMDSVSVRKIFQAVKSNYFLKVLQIDVKCQDRKVLNKMDFWLELNRCGRSILLQESCGNQGNDKLWYSVLNDAAATGDPEILYWILANGAELFARELEMQKIKLKGIH